MLDLVSAKIEQKVDEKCRVTQQEALLLWNKLTRHRLQVQHLRLSLQLRCQPQPRCLGSVNLSECSSAA